MLTSRSLGLGVCLLGCFAAGGCGAAADEPSAFAPDTPSEPPPLLYDGFESPTLAPFWRPGSETANGRSHAPYGI